MLIQINQIFALRGWKWRNVEEYHKIHSLKKTKHAVIFTDNQENLHPYAYDNSKTKYTANFYQTGEVALIQLLWGLSSRYNKMLHANKGAK